MIRLFPLLFVWLWLGSAAFADELPVARDFAADGTHAINQATPIVVLFTAPYCRFCITVKAEYFRHLERDPRYADRILVREVIINSDEALEDFAGSTTTHRDFADDNQIALVPTVRIFDGAGGQITEPLVGVVSMDMYGWYMSQRIDDALRALEQMSASEKEPG
jgi:thioredoxin-related protein